MPFNTLIVRPANAEALRTVALKGLSKTKAAYPQRGNRLSEKLYQEAVARATHVVNVLVTATTK